MPLFHKVIGKKCMNPATPPCPEFGVLKDASEYLCDKCNLELTPVTKPNPPVILAVALGVFLAAGLVAYAVTHVGGFELPGLSDGVAPPGDGQRSDGGIAVKYAVQADGGGRPRMVASDYVFHSGDRFRLLLKAEAKSSVLYVYYEDRQKGRMEALYPDGGRAQLLESGEVASVPPGEGGWISLDDTPGAEQFVILAAAHPLDDLPDSSCSREEFDRALKQIRTKQGLTETRATPGPEWVEAKGRNGALVARLTVKHR